MANATVARADAVLDDPRAARAGAPRWLLWAGFGLLVVVGLFNLALPFRGDQALFMQYAKQMDHGAVLYRDVLDWKQPGVFLFYLVGGKLFTWNEVGVHVAELLWWMAFSAVLVVTIGPRYVSRALKAIVPLGMGIVYFLGAEVFDLTQVETLICFPLFVAWWLARQPDPGTTRGRLALVGAGFAAGVVVMFKHLCLLIPVSLWIVALIRQRRRGDTTRQLAATVGWLAVGLAPILAAFAVWVAVNGLTSTVWDAFVVWPRQSLQVSPPPLRRAAEAIHWMAVRYLPLWLLAAYAVWRWLRTRTNAIVGELVLWMVGATAILAVQHYWKYQFYLLFVPMVLLAGFGADELIRTLRTHRRRTELIAAGLLVLSLPLAAAFGVKVKDYVTNDMALTTAGRHAIRVHEWPDIGIVEQSEVFLHEPDAKPGPIYAISDPTYVLLSGRDQAVPLHGWAPEFNNAERWQELGEDLQKAAPPYIFVDQSLMHYVTDGAPLLTSMLHDQYSVHSTDAIGTWYVRNT